MASRGPDPGVSRPCRPLTARSWFLASQGQRAASVPSPATGALRVPDYKGPTAASAQARTWVKDFADPLGDPLGDHPGAERTGGGPAAAVVDAPVEDQADLVGA